MIAPTTIVLAVLTMLSTLGIGLFTAGWLVDKWNTHDRGQPTPRDTTPVRSHAPRFA